VVFNHTAEGKEDGPTLCFRGLANDLYYILEPDRSRYAKYTGTGNTLNGNNSIVRRMIVDSLRYWVGEMHVDGFRFDLASILARDAAGHVMPNPPVLWDIESDPLPAGTKLIAEAWDAAGLYQVGSFVGDSWREWNGRFRDDARDSPQPSLALRRFPRKSLAVRHVFTAEITASSIGGAFTSTGPSFFSAAPARYFCPSLQARPDHFSRGRIPRRHSDGGYCCRTCLA
jgi:hypothetical protein